MNDSVDAEDIKEVYARFGLAFYAANVLEYGIVNALVVVDLIPSRRHLARSRAEWEASVDEFTGGHFEHTMGRLMRDLRSLTTIPADLDDLLRRALNKRNWLAHEFFRDRDTEFLTSDGRSQMIDETNECRELFRDADDALENVVKPLRISAGITDEMINQLLQTMMPQSQA